MENFNLKKFLVENKLTYNSRMLKEDINIKEVEQKYNKGEILTLVTKDGDSNGEVIVDSVSGTTVIGYMQTSRPTPIQVKITPAKNGEGYDVYDMEQDIMIRNNHNIVPKK
jgi:hypothetical protein